jgi:hypothetical protein
MASHDHFDLSSDSKLVTLYGSVVRCVRPYLAILVLVILITVGPRISKCRISNSHCTGSTAIQWVPSSANLFRVSHTGDSIVVYEMDCEDGVFTSQAPTMSLASPRPLTNDSAPPSSKASSLAGEWNPLDSIFVTIPSWQPSMRLKFKQGVEKAAGKQPWRNPWAKERCRSGAPSVRIMIGGRVEDELDFYRLCILIRRQVRTSISGDNCPRVIDAWAEQYAFFCAHVTEFGCRIIRHVDCYAAYFGSLMSSMVTRVSP